MEQWELDYTPKDWLNEFRGENEATEVQHGFCRMLLSDYYSMLEREYDYLTSREAIAKSLKCNEVEFSEDGSLA